MKIAFLILAHRNPAQVARLCRALHHPQADLFVHVDRKADQAPFEQAVGSAAPGVRFVRRRTDIRWGGFSMVRATLEGLRELLAAGEYAYVRLLSGQDYPLAPIGRFIAALEARPGAQYIAWTPLDDRNDYVRRLSRRYRYHHLSFRNRRLTLLVNRLLRRLTVRPRVHPAGDVYKGSQWWTLGGECVRYVLDYVAQHPEVMRFYRTVSCPDELFFQTVLLHSPFAASVVNDNGLYADWSAGGMSPELLTSRDFDRVAACGAWFARKFDTQTDSRILDRIDERLLGRTPGLAGAEKPDKKSFQ